jgi:hypothetical protein
MLYTFNPDCLLTKFGFKTLLKLRKSVKIYLFLKLYPFPLRTEFYIQISENIWLFQFSFNCYNFTLGYGLDDQVSIPNRGKEDIFFFALESKPAVGPIQPPIPRLPDALSPGAKRPGREADLSLPSSAEVKNACNYMSTPPYVLMA